MNDLSSPPRSSPPRLSGVVAAENEELVIERCLRSLAFCDEIIVVDGGSADRTVPLAEAAGARVVRHSSLEKGIHFNKNLGAESASGDWILSLDADEEITGELAREIRAAIATDDFDSFRLPRKTYFLGEWIRHSGWWPCHIVRLWRRGATEWPLEVHDVPRSAGRCGTLVNAIEHHSYGSLSDWVKKANHFSGCEAEEFLRRSGAPSLSRLVMGLTLYPVGVFFRKLVRSAAWKDGMPGLVIAGSAAVASWLRAAKLWETATTGRRQPLGGRERLGAGTGTESK